MRNGIRCLLAATLIAGVAGCGGSATPEAAKETPKQSTVAAVVEEPKAPPAPPKLEDTLKASAANAGKDLVPPKPPGIFLPDGEPDAVGAKAPALPIR